MAEPNWADEAVRYAAGLTRMTLASDRGVFDSDTTGVSFAFAPDSEKGRVDDEFTAAGIEVLGIGTSLGGARAPPFGWPAPPTPRPS